MDFLQDTTPETEETGAAMLPSDPGKSAEWDKMHRGFHDLLADRRCLCLDISLHRWTSRFLELF